MPTPQGVRLKRWTAAAMSLAARSGSPTCVAWNLPSSPAAPPTTWCSACVLSTIESTNRSPAPLRPSTSVMVVEQTKPFCLAASAAR